MDIVNAPCDDENGGSAIVYVDGVGPLNYSWLNISGEIISTASASLGNLASGTYQFIVSTDNGCEDLIDVFIDTDGDPVSIAQLGDDIEICDDNIVISANLPLADEVGLWNLVSGQGDILSPNSSETLIENLGIGINTFAWSLSNECGSSLDEISITVINGQPTIIDPGDFFCLDQIPLVADVQNGEGTWTVTPSFGVSIEDPLSTNTFATVTEYGSYTFSFEGCNGIASQTINMDTSSPELFAPVEVFCLESFELEAVIDGDPGLWSGVGPGNIQFNSTSILNPTVLVDNYGEYEFTYDGCGASSSISVEMVDPNMSIEDPGIIYCAFDAEISASTSFSGSWSVGDIPAGTSMNIDSNDSSVLVTVSDYGEYEIIFTSCGVSDTTMLTFTTIEPYVITTDHQNCLFTIDLYAITPALNSAFWEQISGPSQADIVDIYANSTQAIVSEFGMYTFAFTSCDYTVTFDVGISCPMTVPNSFSPNEDGVNDLFQIPDLNPNVYTQSILYIYNKWGAVIYINPNYGLDGEWWDGKTTYHAKPFSALLPERYYDNNSGYVSDGTYYYTLEVYNITNEQKEFYSGDISVFSK